MANSQFLHLPAGMGIGKLFLLPDVSNGQSASPNKVPENLLMATIALSDQRPMLTITMAGKAIRGLLDSGADVTVIAKQDWPGSLPLQQAAAVYGVGGFTAAQQSAHNIMFQSEDKVIQLKPLVMDIPLTLWGRDLLSQLGAVIHTNLS